MWRMMYCFFKGFSLLILVGLGLHRWIGLCFSTHLPLNFCPFYCFKNSVFCSVMCRFMGGTTTALTSMSPKAWWRNVPCLTSRGSCSGSTATTLRCSQTNQSWSSSRWCNSLMSSQEIKVEVLICVCALRCVSSCLNTVYCSTVWCVRRSLWKERSSWGFVPKESSSTRLKMDVDPPARASSGGRRQPSPLMWVHWCFSHGINLFSGAQLTKLMDLCVPAEA